MKATTMTKIDKLLSLLRARGHERFDGEVVTHLEHALQCAMLAERAGGEDPLMAAALLHDIGHLLSGCVGAPSARSVDDQHEQLGANALDEIFGPAVALPVRWHVAAKRCLAADRMYYRLLSVESRRSLALQGGAMEPTERAVFLAQPCAADALRLRQWDEAAKRARLKTPSLDHFATILSRVASANEAKVLQPVPSAVAIPWNVL